MSRINGNINASIELKEDSKNSIGENIIQWKPYKTLFGWLDYANGDSGHLNFLSKVEESTHIFICDYVDVGMAKPNNSRMIINNKIYEVKLIDNPMELNRQLEIYLKYVGVQ